jgi:hypothetical protein
MAVGRPPFVGEEVGKIVVAGRRQLVGSVSRAVVEQRQFGFAARAPIPAGRAGSTSRWIVALMRRSISPRASITEIIHWRRGSVLGECPSLSRCSMMRSSWLSTAHCCTAQVFDLLGQVEEVERAIPTLIGKTTQRPRLVARPRVEILVVQLRRPSGHRRAPVCSGEPIIGAARRHHARAAANRRLRYG